MSETFIGSNMQTTYLFATSASYGTSWAQQWEPPYEVVDIPAAPTEIVVDRSPRKPVRLPAPEQGRLKEDTRRWLYQFPGNHHEWARAVEACYRALGAAGLVVERYYIFNELARLRAVSSRLYQAACEAAYRWPNECGFPDYVQETANPSVPAGAGWIRLSERKPYWPDESDPSPDPWTEAPDQTSMIEV